MHKDSNIELMRLIFMFLICMVHAVGYVPSRWQHWLTNISFVGVIGFVLISGYFGIKFKFSKAIKIEGVGIGCAITVIATAWLCGTDFTLTSAFTEARRLFKGYWFIHAYVVMMVLANLVQSSKFEVQSLKFKVQSSNSKLQTPEAVAKPPLHVDAFVSNASDKDGFLHIDAIETIASTGFATASPNSKLQTSNSLSLKTCLPYFILIYGWSFLMLIPGVQHLIPRSPGLEPFSGLTLFATYLVGRLYRQYDCDHRWSWKTVLPVLAISLLFVATLWPFKQFAGAFARYNSPFLVVASICVFWLLRKIPVSTRVQPALSLITPSVLSIYLIHCNDYGKCAFLFFEQHLNGLPQFVAWLLLAALAFVGGLLLDLPRRVLARVFSYSVSYVCEAVAKPRGRDCLNRVISG